jgi:uncharacterized protein (TIGR03000 family)
LASRLKEDKVFSRDSQNHSTEEIVMTKLWFCGALSMMLAATVLPQTAEAHGRGWYGGYGGGYCGGYYGGYYGRGFGGYYGCGFGYGGYAWGGYYPGYMYAGYPYYAYYNPPPYPGPGRVVAYGTLNVEVPVPEAEVWIQGQRTVQGGTNRKYQFTPPPSGQNYAYEVKARWREGDRDVEQTQTVPIQPGVPLSVSFSKKR